MSGLLSALGGALSGIGSGIVIDAQQRREAALRLLEDERREQREDRRDDRRLDQAVTLAGKQAEREEAKDARIADRQDKADERRFGQQKDLIGMQGAETRANAKYSSDLDAGRDAGKMTRAFTDADGNEIGVYANGKTKVLGRAAATGKADAGSATLSESDSRTIAQAVAMVERNGGAMLNDDEKQFKIAENLRATGNANLIPYVLDTVPLPLPARDKLSPSVATGRDAKTGQSGSTGAPKSDTKKPQNVVPYVAGAKKAPDGHYYVPDPNRPGRYLKVS